MPLHLEALTEMIMRHLYCFFIENMCREALKESVVVFKKCLCGVKIWNLLARPMLLWMLDHFKDRDAFI